MGTGFGDLLPALEALTDPTRAVGLAEAAELTGLSPSRLQRVVTATVGESPASIDRRVRLDLAAILLRATDERVLDIALATGFESHEGFTRAFRSQFDCAPSAWRAERGPLDDEQVAISLAVSRCGRLHHRPIDQPATRKAHPVSYEISIEELDPVPVIYQERRVDRDELGAVLAEILPAVFGYVMGEGLAPAGHPFVRYIGMSAAFVTIQAGIPLAEAPAGMPPSETGLVASELPGGPAAVTVHQGPYEQLGDAHAALDRWIGESDHAPAGGPWELYLTDPGEVPDPAQWMTKICWPVS